MSKLTERARKLKTDIPAVSLALKPTRKPIPEETFIDIAIDHGLASPDTADKTYRKVLRKMKKELKKKDIS